jgi:hypothetical protein
MDHAALQSQIAGCLQYAGAALTYAGGTLYGALERVGIEDSELGGTAPIEGFRLTYSKAALDPRPRSGTILTTAAGQRYRILTEPSTHPTADTAECLVEPIT